MSAGLTYAVIQSRIRSGWSLLYSNAILRCQYHEYSQTDIHRNCVGRFSNRGLATIDTTHVVRGAGLVLQRLGVGQPATCLRPALLPVLES